MLMWTLVFMIVLNGELVMVKLVVEMVILILCTIRRCLRRVRLIYTRQKRRPQSVLVLLQAEAFRLPHKPTTDLKDLTRLQQPQQRTIITHSSPSNSNALPLHDRNQRNQEPPVPMITLMTAWVQTPSSAAQLSMPQNTPTSTKRSPHAHCPVFRTRGTWRCTSQRERKKEGKKEREKETRAERQRVRVRERERERARKRWGFE